MPVPLSVTAIITWGSFFFRIKDKNGTLKLVDDSDLDHVHPPRHQTIGAQSESYGPAVVTVRDAVTGEVVAVEGTTTTNHVRIT